MKINRSLLVLAILFGLTGLCLYPSESKQAIIEALQVCGNSVIPALFPFFVLTKLLTSNLSTMGAPKFLDKLMGGLFGVSGTCFSPLLMSFLGGYPVGVSCVASLYEEGSITKKDAEDTLLFCNNSGPAFFVGVVGSVVLQSVKHGLLLYFIHITSAVLVGRLFCNGAAEKAKIRRLSQKSEPPSQQFLNAVTNSCGALLQISSLILFFSVLLALLECIGFISLLQKLPLGISEKELGAVIYGILELTGGVLRLSNTSMPFVFSAFFMGWGGLCVHFQAMSLWQKVGLRPKGYFLAKLLHAAVSALLASCYLQPNVINLGLVCITVTISVVFPQIRKKRSRNHLRYAV